MDCAALLTAFTAIAAIGGIAQKSRDVAGTLTCGEQPHQTQLEIFSFSQYRKAIFVQQSKNGLAHEANSVSSAVGIAPGFARIIRSGPTDTRETPPWTSP